MDFSSKKEYYAFAKDIDAALAEVAKKYGVTMKAGNGRFNGDAMTMKLEVVNISETGEAQDKYAVAFKQYATRFGFVASDLGRTFKGHSGIYTISGLNTRGRTMPIIGTRNGKNYKFEADFVKANLL